MSADEATITRVAKAIYARRNTRSRFTTAAILDRLWLAIDESERTQYRLDAVAAIKAMENDT